MYLTDRRTRMHSKLSLLHEQCNRLSVSVYTTAKLLLSISGSQSSPDEDRLLVHLFDPQYQPNNLLTTPIHNISGYVKVDFDITLIKLIALVKSKDLHTYCQAYYALATTGGL